MVWMMFLCLILSSCHAAQETIKEFNMPVYEVEKFDLELRMGTYWLLNRQDNPLLETYGCTTANYLTDAEGKIVFKFVGTGGMWENQKDAIAFGGGNYMARLPKHLHMEYYDGQENRSYRLDVDLPIEKMYEFYKQPILDPFEYKLATKRIIKIGVAPQGHIFVWAGIGYGFPKYIELAQYKATEAQPSAEVIQATKECGLIGYWDEFSKPNEYLERNLTAETLQKLRSGWLPSPDVYLERRIKYPWRMVVSNNAQIEYYTVNYANNEADSAFLPEEMERQQYSLKAVPSTLSVTLKNKQGKRANVLISFFPYEGDGGKIIYGNVEEVTHIFKRLYPQRTAEQNEQKVAATDYTELRIDINDDLTHIDGYFSKVGVKYPVNDGFFVIEPLKDYQLKPGMTEEKPEDFKRLFEPLSHFK